MPECAEEGQGVLALLVQEMHRVGLDRLPALLNQHASALGLHEITIFLADIRQETLVSVPEDAQRPSQRLAVDSSDAGWAYRTSEMKLLESRTGDLQLWLPLVDGVERIGVLDVRAPSLDKATLRICQTLASLLALGVSSMGHYSDTYSRLERSAPMRLSAELVWAYMPPRTIGTHQVTSSAVLEPAYELGGDAYDHSLIDGDLHVTILDAMGHDLLSGLTSTVAMASCRQTRRSGTQDLERIATTADKELDRWFPDRQLTAIFAHLHVNSGLLRWVNCGHPVPLLLRDGDVAAHALERGPQMSLGLGATNPDRTWRTDTAQLEPGDRVLFYTDGVPDAKSPSGEPFGEERFTDFIIRAIAAGEPAPEALRRLIKAVLTYQQGRMTDDAAIVMFQWHPTRT